ncbi:uncharacterized protein LOC119559709 isoform X2 [Drosophila subpulchrella]|uniref:uncharacterized protein LOC119559709 isoform X2 n=1 Tax=Drosophila subpulchrella TaxID=1486046 RepID=UPI0018A1A9BC|nr:uncharacterized protein LOC119559709 isoform X2 [Drosophila subpulchrella]
MEKKTQKPRQKRLQEFNSEEKVRLIQAVEERPVLWDLVHKKHFDAVFMKRTWEEIALVMDKDYNSCKLAWKSLRDSLKYHNKVRKQKSGSAGGDLLEKPSGKECAEWEFAPYMDFLPDVSSQRRTTSSAISDEISIEDWTLDSTTISYLQLKRSWRPRYRMRYPRNYIPTEEEKSHPQRSESWMVMAHQPWPCVTCWGNSCSISGTTPLFQGPY